MLPYVVIGRRYKKHMSYTINQLAKIADVSIRTLHHYDAIGLLTPTRNAKNLYRTYEEGELLRLQQILFFRELDLPLTDIKNILGSPNFDISEALKDHRKMILLKKKRLDALVVTIDKTIKRINKKTTMEDKELYGNFSKEEMERYTEEARKKWGNTEAFKQSEERVKKMGKDGLKRVLEASGKLTVEISVCMKNGDSPSSEKVQKLIAMHYDGLRAFYEPNLEIYAGLANAYIADERFKANYESVAPGLAQFMHDAMIAYCEAQA